jgi:hypothetical protein
MTDKIVKVRCIYCNRYIDRPKYNSHVEKDHQLVYVAIEKSDLNRLVQYMYTKDESLLTRSLMETLQVFQRNMAKRELTIKEE